MSELVGRKLEKILNGEDGARNSESSANVDPLKLGLSVFLVCRACNIDLGIKDRGRICQLVSSGPALGQLGEIQNDFPALQQ